MSGGDIRNMDPLQGIPSGTSFVPEEPTGYAVHAIIQDVRDVFGSLSAINFNDVATLYFTKDGMKASIGEVTCFQATVNIPASVFQNYDVEQDLICFQVNYPAFLKCINIYGRIGADLSSSCKLCYPTRNAALKIVTECSGVVTKCLLKTMEADEEIADVSPSSSKIVNTVIMQAKVLKQAWQDLDMTKEDFAVWISDTAPFICLKADSLLLKTTVTIPKDSKAVQFFESLESSKNMYQRSFLRPISRSSNIASRVSLRTNTEGILYVEFMVDTIHNHNCFVDFMCHPNVEIDASSISASEHEWPSACTSK